jgi:hypothetical protein
MLGLPAGSTVGSEAGSDAGIAAPSWADEDFSVIVVPLRWVMRRATLDVEREKLYGTRFLEVKRYSGFKKVGEGGLG